jgi:pimeloyl-ACP methyl ester carboxylesterase
LVSLDLRGIGQSSIASGGYEADTLAKDVYELAMARKLDGIYIVGHDLGGQVAYAFARQYPSATRGAILLDAPLPGIDGLGRCRPRSECLAHPFHAGSRLA